MAKDNEMTPSAYWSTLYGTYANWLTTTFAAIFGTAAANPIISAGHHGQPWQEQLAAAGFLSVAIVIIVSVVLILWVFEPESRSMGET
jgi:(hydroxyamino)benzene mutase